MSLKVGDRTVPVVWSPSDLSGPDSDGHKGRLWSIEAAVHHRVVGTLESMTNGTFKPTFDDRLVQGERRVSSHFGIGFWGDELRIVQYVALEDTAYCNGQSAGDIQALLGSSPWALYTSIRRAAGHHVSANEFTYSIEHEDNAAAGDYVVRDEIIEASIALDRLLLSGDGKAIRAAGIHCNDAAAAQLGAIQPGRTTIVDHHVAAPVSKPYCWRPIGRDKGFPQARYLAALTSEEDVQGLTLTKSPNGPARAGKVTLTDNDVVIRLSDRERFEVGPGTRPATGPHWSTDLKVDGYIVEGLASTGGEHAWIHETAVDFAPSSSSSDDVDAAYNAGVAAAAAAAATARRA